MGASVQRMPAVSRPAWMLALSGTIHRAAAARGLPVAEISAHFLPPWAGKFASDCFHPSQDGYRDWARALLANLPSTSSYPLSSTSSRG
jgi:lysophospholipase L1-like esterase